MTKIVMAAVAAALPMLASADTGWIQFAPGSEFKYPDNIPPHPSAFHFWMRRPAANSTLASTGIESGYVVTLIEANCNLNGLLVWRQIQITLYDAAGHVVRDGQAPPKHQAWSPTVPGSQAEMVIKRICSH